MKNVGHCHARLLLAVIVSGLACAGANAAVTILGVQYQPDKMHPEFDCIWNNSNYPNSCPSNFPGANIHVYLRNDNAASLNVTNVTLAGYELKTIVKLRNQGQNDPYSIYYYWDDPPQAIFDAGEPVWFRHDPTNLPPGAVFQVVVRLRLIPVTQPVSVGVMTDAGTVTTNVAVDANAPQLASVGFSKDLDKVYLHWRRSDGAVPTTILMDGSNVTSLTTTVGDANRNYGVSVITLTNSLSYMSYHVFQGIYADGKTATASLRAWVNNFNIGTYGAYPTTTWADARALIDDYENRGVNFIVYNNGSEGLTSFINKPEGVTYAAEHGFDFMPETPSQWNTYDPLGWYLRDEPDAHDHHLTREDNDNPPNLYLPENNQHSVGILAMPEIYKGDDLHYRQGKITPTVVNVDATYMPYNYYTYGQMADIGMSDPYYTSRQAHAYWNDPDTIPLYVKPYPYIYAVSQAITEGSEPNPSLIAMNSTGEMVVTNGWWPYSTAEDIRMENYYAVAGGAKSLAYWWMLSGFGDGIVTNAGPPTALWKGIGLCGNEFRTVQPLIVISHPAALTITTSTNIWARGLIAGMDAVLLLIANDRYTNDINGFHYSPVSNASVTVTLPAWFNGSATSFEIAEQAKGVTDVSTALTNGNQLTVNLGTVNLTRLIVVTTNASWRATIQKRYLETSYQGVCTFAPELCPAQYTCILNADAEGGFRNRGDGVIANNWFEFEGADGTNIVCYDETTITHGGGHSQRIRTWKAGVSSPGASGGVYQRIPALPGTNYTISVWTYAGDSGSFCYLGVDPSGKTDPSTGVTWSSANNSSSWVQKTWNGNATSNFMTIYYRVVSTNGNKRNGYFDDATPACTSPTITQNPTGATNCPGATTNFTVAASGSGTFAYQWQRSGINLTDAGHYSGVNTPTLTVSGFDGNDTGDYRCAVTTSYGVIYSSPATLAVRQATTITQQPVAHDVCSGGNTTFTVAAIGDGTLTYQWQKNLANINNGGHYSGCTTATLTITGADASDVANYRCVVTGGCGNSISFQGALSLATNTPTITGNPSPKDICPGGTVNFYVTATGSGVLTYQWQKNGVNLSNGGHYSGVTTATLTVTGADAGDAASYRCVVANNCGGATSGAAALTLGAIPVLLNGSFEGSTNAPGVATNWVAYQRSPNPTTVWTLQTNVPPSGAGVQYQQMANTSSTGGAGVRQDITGCTMGATYAVAGWMRGNSANAVCTVKVSPTASTSWATAINLNPPQTTNGSTWTAFSGTVVATGTNMTLWLDGQTTGTGQNKAECFDAVTVTCVGGVQRPDITGQPSAQNVCPGVNASFSATASGGGTLAYQWQTNGVNLSNNSHYGGATAATLWVTNVQSADAANYRCVVSNEGGSTNSSNAALTVKAATTITQQPAAQNLCPGANANFSVAATGDGALTYQWQTNGVNINDGAHYSGCTTANLTVNSVVSADTGNYRCVVTGGCGSANSSTATLTLKAATTITGQPSAQNVCAGANATFSVIATGDGTVTYQWQTNGVNISNGSHYSGCTTATLWVTNTQSADPVNYRCVVTAGCGSANSSTAALTLKAATAITQQPSARNVCPGTTTNFTVAATGDGTLTYQWQTNGVNISNGSHYSGCTAATLWVTNASSADAVNYRCVVTAGCGSVNSSTVALTLKTVTSITAQPVSVQVSSGGTTNFTVIATGDTLTYQWQKNNTNLSNGGHYSGVTTATLTISSASSADAANYRCVVTGSCGSATSSPATLIVCVAPTLLNASFELANISGVATNWIGYQRSPNPTTVWTIQTASPPAGAGTNYQQIANTSSAGGGGVRQDIKNCVIGARYTIAGWFRGNSQLYSTCTVKVSPTASTSWATATNLNPPATFTGSYWTNFSGTVVATGTNMTLWLDGQTGSTGLNKAECFDAITVTCTP